MTARPGLSVRRIFIAVLVGLLTLSSAQARQDRPAPWVGKRLDGGPCKGGFPTDGPYDYLNKSHQTLYNMIEEFHFTESVAKLIRGSSSTPMGDIDFVLRAIPNHHPALNSATTFSLRHKRYPPGEKGLPAECYLQRAINFAPRDPFPAKLYGYYLHEKKRYKLALQANLEAMKLLPNDAMLRYNTGLLLVEVKQYKKAMEMARPLYDAGLDLPGLKNKLIRAGAWEFTEEEKAQYRKYLEARQSQSEVSEEDKEKYRAYLRERQAAKQRGLADPNDPGAAQQAAAADPNDPTAGPLSQATTDQGIDAAVTEQ
tara:strand:+ start:66 stop:1004 length:939 start_codon:yes stop_codon:yes gene_type:complete